MDVQWLKTCAFKKKKKELLLLLIKSSRIWLMGEQANYIADTSLTVRVSFGEAGY